jgi:dihydroflavonol-4-reductase
LGVELAEGSLEDSQSLARAVGGCRYLFHVAADYRLWVPERDAMFRTNVEGTRDLLTAAISAGVERVVYTSSVATLGLVPEGSADEETPSSAEDMIGPYKRSKFLAEEVVRRLVAEHGLPAIIVNPSTPLGARDLKPTPTGRLILEAARGHMPGYVDTGLNIVHVDDVAAGHLAAAETGRIGERYILGGENISLERLLAEVAQLVGTRPPHVRVPYSVAYPVAIGAELVARATGREPFITVDGVRMARKRMYFSSAKACREFGYRPRPAWEAIADAVAWFRANGDLR